MRPLVLVVEDNPDNRKLITWVLEDADYRHIITNSAEEALQLLERQRVDIVLMDISLPGMDGKEATRRLRADSRWHELPVIAVTAHAIKEEMEDIRGSGVSALVTKPIEEEVLLQTMQSLLRTGGG